MSIPTGCPQRKTQLDLEIKISLLSTRFAAPAWEFKIAYNSIKDHNFSNYQIPFNQAFKLLQLMKFHRLRVFRPVFRSKREV